MLTSEQMLFTMAVFGHVLIAGITLLIAVILDDSLWLSAAMDLFLP
jgi:hypothetical protein